MDYLTYYYLICKQHTVNFYNSVIINFFGFNDMRAITNNRQSNVAWRYMLFSVVTYLINILSSIKYKLDIKPDIFHLTRITNDGERTFILNGDNGVFENARAIINSESHKNTMSNYAIMTCELETPTTGNSNNNLDCNEKHCMKSFIVKYKDPLEEYPHTLENIFKFNNVSYNGNSLINIKFVRNRKIKTTTLQLNDVIKKHINYLVD